MRGTEGRLYCAAFSRGDRFLDGCFPRATQPVYNDAVGVNHQLRGDGCFYRRNTGNNQGKKKQSNKLLLECSRAFLARKINHHETEVNSCFRVERSQLARLLSCQFEWDCGFQCWRASQFNFYQPMRWPCSRNGTNFIGENAEKCRAYLSNLSCSTCGEIPGRNPHS